MNRASLVPPLASYGRLALTESELRAWGRRLGEAVTPPLLVTIAGDLGAGKTTLVQSICSGYGVAEDVTSPTFALVHVYTAPQSRVYHVDLYRLGGGPGDLDRIGWEDLLADHALTLVEWPERAGSSIPRDHVPIRLEHLPGDPSRRLLYAGGDAMGSHFGEHS